MYIFTNLIKETQLPMQSQNYWKLNLLQRKPISSHLSFSIFDGIGLSVLCKYLWLRCCINDHDEASSDLRWLLWKTLIAALKITQVILLFSDCRRCSIEWRRCFQVVSKFSTGWHSLYLQLRWGTQSKPAVRNLLDVLKSPCNFDIQHYWNKIIYKVKML